jgi:hypothetical protein
MTTFTDSRYHTRNLIQSFALIDEGFDEYLFSKRNEPRISALYELNSKVGVLMSLPLTERIQNAGSIKRALSPAELQRFSEIIPCNNEETPINLLFLREALRDRLYDLLLRLDHCSMEQLFSRYVIIPPDSELCLFHLNQLVVHMASGCVRDFQGCVASE